MDDGVRGRPGPTYRAAANLGVRAGMGGRRDRAGDRGRALREEEDGPDAWGRPVSGATRASGGARHAEERSGPRAWAVLAWVGKNGRGEVGLRGAGLRAEVRLAGPMERGSRPGRCVVRTGRGGEVRAARGEGLRGRVGLVLGLVGPGFWAGLGFLGWIGFGVFLFLSNASPISFLFPILTQTMLNSNLDLNPTQAFKQTEEMLQHDATTTIKTYDEF